MTTVVGYIPTEVGEKALNAAIDHATRSGSPIVLLNIVRESRQGDPRHATAEQLEYAATTARRAGVRDVDTRSIHIDDSDKLAHILMGEAEKIGATLIVVGARREAGVPLHLMGVTLQNVVAGASCNVLVA